MSALFRALAIVFLGAGIVSLLAYLPLHDGYRFTFLWGIEPYCPVLFILLLAVLVFMSLAAWCHRQANRRRFIR